MRALQHGLPLLQSQPQPSFCSHEACRAILTHFLTPLWNQTFLQGEVGPVGGRQCLETTTSVVSTWRVPTSSAGDWYVLGFLGISGGAQLDPCVQPAMSLSTFRMHNLSEPALERTEDTSSRSIQNTDLHGLSLPPKCS